MHLGPHHHLNPRVVFLSKLNQSEYEIVHEGKNKMLNKCLKRVDVCV